MRAFSPVTAVVIDGERPWKPPNAKSLGFSDTLWELVQRCWSVSGSDRPTAQELFGDLSAASRNWVFPPVYPIELGVDDDAVASANSSDLLKAPLTNVIPNA